MSKNNRAEFAGVILDKRFSHETRGERFYKFSLSIGRKRSKVHDILPCVAPEIVISEFENGDMIHVYGSIRSMNHRRHLKVYVFCEFAEKAFGSCINEVVLSGFIVKKGDIRKTPVSKLRILDTVMAVNRPTRKGDYIPAIFFNRNSLRASATDAIEEVTVIGRFQSRVYQKEINGEMIAKTTYELAVSELKIGVNENGENNN